MRSAWISNDSIRLATLNWRYRLIAYLKSVSEILYGVSDITSDARGASLHPIRGAVPKATGRAKLRHVANTMVESLVSLSG